MSCFSLARSTAAYRGSMFIRVSKSGRTHHEPFCDPVGSYTGAPNTGRRGAVFLTRDNPIWRDLFADVVRADFDAENGHASRVSAAQHYEAGAGPQDLPIFAAWTDDRSSSQVWATDITCIPMARGFVYLCAVMDWSSRRILASASNVGWVKRSATQHGRRCPWMLGRAVPEPRFAATTLDPAYVRCGELNCPGG